MTILDNITSLLGDDLKRTITPGAKLKIAASCFSIYAFEALKKELSQIDSLEFIFTSPTFVPNDVSDKLRKEHREFHIPKMERERSLYGSEFEVRLRNELTQKAIARECAEWMRKKATFRSNRGRAPMPQFACAKGAENESVYMPLHGFTAVDLGYPPQTLFNRVLPKSRIYAHARPGRAVKELFVSRIGGIVWKHKLSPETLHLPARRGITEIQVFEIALKSEDCETVLLRAIDKAIPFPILFQLTHADRIRFAASYKRPGDAVASQWVIEASFVLPWQSATAERPPLPVALDLAALHDQPIRRHIPLASRPGESIRDHVSRHLSIEAKQREARQLESRLTKECQFNRKVELNAALRSLREQILDLDGERMRPRVLSPAPSPETCVDESPELSPHSTAPGREGATRDTRGRVCSPNQESQQ